MLDHIAEAMKEPDVLRLDRNVYVLRFEMMKLHSALETVRRLLADGVVEPSGTLMDNSNGTSPPYPAPHPTRRTSRRSCCEHFASRAPRAQSQLIALEWLQFGLGRLVAAAEEEGLTVHPLLTEDRQEYAHELSRLYSPHLVVHDVDTHSVRQVVAAARQIGDLAGLLSTTDTWSLVALAAREELGLPGQAPEGVRLVRDKGRLRRRLYQHGLSHSPRAIRTRPAARSAQCGAARTAGPDFLVLSCLRGDHEGGAGTYYADARDVCRALDPAALEIPRSPLFRTNAPDSYVREAAGCGQVFSAPVPMISNPESCPEVSAAANGIRTRDERARAALDRLQEFCG
ncbi:hypothetical protein ACIA74_21220 [Streptomyces sp. NPDC051658]|uniref:hypothetical protein n=1 Tax=Streptomyces sp. NPDC051658 TaxID=3365667 RepID=UPI0037ABE2FC